MKILTPPPLDEKQALRLRRLGLAALIYGVTTLLLASAWSFGALPGTTLAEIVLSYFMINVGFYVAIRSGYNLRFEDPSLTQPQMLTAISVLMFAIYHLEYGRHISLLVAGVVLVFGGFRLNAREYTLVALYTLAAYALVVDLLMYLRPQAIEDVRLEWLSWVMLAGVLPGFTIVGGQINTLRRRLRESEARFRGLAELSSDWYWEQDADFRFTVMSGGVENKGQFVVNEALGKTRWELPIELGEAEWADHRATLEAHRAFADLEYKIVVSDGSSHYYSVRGEPLFDVQGKFTGYRGTANDITARKRAELAQRESAEKLRMFADNVPVMTSAWDENLCCIFTNKRYADFVGLTIEVMLGKHLREVFGEEVYREIEGHFAAALQGHAVTYQRTRKLANGESRCFEIRVLPHIENQGKVVGCFVVTTDITEHKLAQERTQHVAHHDTLTGLGNRLLFNDRLNQAINLAKRHSRQVALLYLDLNKFKAVNDTLGHSVGDELLKGVAERLQRQVRESDTVARIGGDEFTVILSDIARRKDAEAIAKKIDAALGMPFQLGSPKQALQIGTSIGIAVYPADAQDVDALIKVADSAMYCAKQAGKGLHDSSIA